MGQLPRLSGQDAVRVFCTFGYQVVRQRGSHVRLRDPTGRRRPLTVPAHRELKTGTLRRLVRDAGLTVEEFAAAV